jgi:hypothetical protein
MHTPGPWTVTRGYEIAGAPVWWLIEGAKGVVCEALYASNDDARLIAAAPQLLRALQRLTHPAADDDDLAYALDVIRVATGAP